MTHKDNRTARIHFRVNQELKDWLVEYLRPSQYTMSDFFAEKIRQEQAAHADRFRDEMIPKPDE